MGGLDESTSDIFGTAVEFYAANPNDPGDWILTDKMDYPIRHMDKPSWDGHSADWWYSGVGNLDVHYSSGVGNHFFYYLSKGVPKSGYNASPYLPAGMAGIGRRNAELVWYQALKYMTKTETYKQARCATLEAVGIVFPGNTAKYNAVNNAWKAVNVQPQTCP